jgi:hypothetical protein
MNTFLHILQIEVLKHFVLLTPSAIKYHPVLLLQ